MYEELQLGGDRLDHFLLGIRLTYQPVASTTELNTLVNGARALFGIHHQHDSVEAAAFLKLWPQVVMRQEKEEVDHVWPLLGALQALVPEAESSYVFTYLGQLLIHVQTAPRPDRSLHQLNRLMYPVPRPFSSPFLSRSSSFPHQTGPPTTKTKHTALSKAKVDLSPFSPTFLPPVDSSHRLITAVDRSC